MKYILLLAASFTFLTTQAQDETQAQDSIPFEFNRQAYIYELAKAYNDPAVARMAIYNLLSYNPKNSSLLDTLSLMYFESNQMASAALTAQDAVTINPNDLFATELAAITFERLGVFKKAITFYEKLYTSNFDINTLYKLAFLQMQVKNYIEADANVQSIIEDPKSIQEELIFPLEDNKSQNISLKASAYRLSALIALSQDKTEDAKAMYKKALELSPDFELVQKELAELN